MVNVTIPKTEYRQLRQQAAAYRRFAARFFDLIIKDPIEELVADFRKTNLYTESFLKDLESGLRKSSYSKNYENQSAKARS
jgi:hypothetical protein